MSNSPTIRRRKHSAPLPLRLFATTSVGLEPVLARELRRLGVGDIEPGTRGVAFSGTWRHVYAANLWLRTAHRVLLRVAEFPAPDRQALYQGARAVDWSRHLDLERTLAIDAVSHHSKLDHTQFIARVVKDAIVDQFRDRTGARPSVDPEDPDLQLNARLRGDQCTLSVDTSGERLHRRGYRPRFGARAPLMETLAAGVVLLSGHDGSAPFVDPMCGSGTLLVEAALIGRNIAPGLLGRRFAFQRHRGFDKRLWNDVVAEARESSRAETAPVFGSDVSDEAVRATRAAASGAGMDDVVRLRRADIGDLTPRGEGRVVVNPPYGERLGEISDLAELYARLGAALRERCSGMTAHVLTSSKFLASKIGLQSSRRDALQNGALDCRLLHYEIY